MNMKRIMIDMDNVITNPLFLDFINEFLGTNYKLDDLDEYYLQKLITKDSDKFWDFINNKNLYKGIELFDGCYEVLEKLNKKYDVYIVTAYIWGDAYDEFIVNTLRDKYLFLKEKLPFIKPEKYIFTINKNIINFDIRIDDRLNNLEGSETKLLFTAWHNKNYSDIELKEKGVIRVNNWKDVEKILLKNE